MHPEILRELTDQRGREMRARAHQARLARMAIRVGRRRRNVADETDGYILPAIPDYVDGSFRAEPASTGPASDPAASDPAASDPVASDPVASEAGRAPATHRAA